jgi:hypothetical protein
MNRGFQRGGGFRGGDRGRGKFIPVVFILFYFILFIIIIRERQRRRRIQ